MTMEPVRGDESPIFQTRLRELSDLAENSGLTGHEAAALFDSIARTVPADSGEASQHVNRSLTLAEKWWDDIALFYFSKGTYARISELVSTTISLIGYSPRRASMA
jgi:hypothetical protein